jgi:hypothetical protein
MLCRHRAESAAHKINKIMALPEASISPHFFDYVGKLIAL